MISCYRDRIQCFCIQRLIKTYKIMFEITDAMACVADGVECQTEDEAEAG